MKILFISPEICWPLNSGGKIRSFNLLKALSQKHEVILLSLVENPNQDISGIKKYASRIILIPHSFGKIKKISNLIKSFFVKEPFRVLNFYSKEMKEKILENIQKERPQVLYFEHIYSTQYLKFIRDKKRFLKVLDTHNLYFRFFESLLKSQKNWLTALLDKMQISKLKKYEKEVISLFDLVCVCSEKEKKILSEMVPTKIEVIPNGVDLALYQKLKKDQKDNNLLFIGPFDHLPNEAGIFWFIKKIFPKIQAKVKNVKLYIIGKKPSARILKLKKRQRIYILGYVHEIRPFFEKSKVFIVPLLSGAGTRIKILEAMAARIPVVSTQKGAEGIAVANRKNILIANSEKSFSQAVIQLLENDELCQKITDNAYELVKKKYTWAKSGQRLIEKIKGAK